MMLIEYLPSYYRKSEVFQNLLRAFGKDIDKNNDSIADLENQLFLDTATWGLVLWEKLYGIPTNLNKSIAFRRSAVKAKMRGTGTTTVAMIQNVSESFVNGQVAIEEHNEEYRFDIVMLSVIGIPPNMEDLRAVIEEIKPAHLEYRIIIKYNTWGMVRDKKMTWAEARSRTWREMKEVAL